MDEIEWNSYQTLPTEASAYVVEVSAAREPDRFEEDRHHSVIVPE